MKRWRPRLPDEDTPAWKVLFGCVVVVFVVMCVCELVFPRNR